MFQTTLAYRQMCAGMDRVWPSNAAMDRTGWTAVIYFIEFVHSTWNSAARSSLCPRSWTGAALHLNSVCRGTWSAVWSLWPFGESETSKGRIVYLTSDRRRNCRARWAVANYIHSSQTRHDVRTRDLFVGNYCVFQVRITAVLDVLL